jgi:hypothetical protein
MPRFFLSLLLEEPLVAAGEITNKLSREIDETSSRRWWEKAAE